jgi:transcription elongation factor GreA
MIERHYMTRQGYEALKVKKSELEQRLLEAGQAAGEAAGINSDWHDNPAYDEAIEAMRLLTTKLSGVETQLTNVVFIEDEIVPGKTYDSVERGCRVTVEIDGEAEVYYVGGGADSNPTEGVISYKSPLAQAILGGKRGETRNVMTSSPFLVKILKIESPEIPAACAPPDSTTASPPAARVRILPRRSRRARFWCAGRTPWPGAGGRSPHPLRRSSARRRRWSHS